MVRRCIVGLPACCPFADPCWCGSWRLTRGCRPGGPLSSCSALVAFTLALTYPVPPLLLSCPCPNTEPDPRPRPVLPFHHEEPDGLPALHPRCVLLLGGCRFGGVFARLLLLLLRMLRPCTSVDAVAAACTAAGAAARISIAARVVVPTACDLPAVDFAAVRVSPRSARRWWWSTPSACLPCSQSDCPTAVFYNLTLNCLLLCCSLRGAGGGGEHQVSGDWRAAAAQGGHPGAAFMHWLGLNAVGLRWQCSAAPAAQGGHPRCGPVQGTCRGGYLLPMLPMLRQRMARLLPVLRLRMPWVLRRRWAVPQGCVQA